MKNRHVVIFGLLPLALFLIGAAAVSRDLVIQNAANAPGLTIIKPGSQTSNLIEAFIGSGSKLSLSRDGNMALNGYLSLSGETNRLTVADGSLLLDGAAVGGNSGDPFVITSELADNATNVALVVDTDVTWNASGAKTSVFRRNGTNVLSIAPHGGIAIGANAEDENFYGTITTNHFLQSYFIPGLGDPDTLKVELGVIDDADWENASESYLSMSLDPDDHKTTLFLTAYSLTNTSTWSMSARNDRNSEFYYQNANSEKPVYFAPALYDANDPLTAAMIGVSETLSRSNSVLLAVHHDMTNKFSILRDGPINAARALGEPAAPSAGYFTLFAVDNGSGKMVLKVRFPTGASQTIATEP